MVLTPCENKLFASDLIDLGIVNPATPSSINDLTDTGIYFVASATPDGPSTTLGYWVYVVIQASSNRVGQFACHVSQGGEVYYRGYSNGWGSWNKLTP